MTSKIEFRLVFDKLEEAVQHEGAFSMVGDVEESAAIRELQRLCETLTQPAPRFHTGT